MSEWKEVKIEFIKAESQNALATGPFGSAISSKFFKNDGVPVIRGSNLSPEISKRLIENEFAFITKEKAKEFQRSIVRKGDLIFTCWGTINQVGLIDDRACFDEYVISNKQMKLTPHVEKAEALFLYYFFSSPQAQDYILGNNIGSSVPGFNLGQLKNFKILLPPLPEQTAIASVLSSLDDKIDLLHRQNATLEKMAETLFRQWFVEEAKEEWEGGKLGDEFDFVMGASPPGESYNEEGNGIPMYQGNADFGFRFPTNRVFTTDPKRFAEKFDTLISVRAPVGEQNMANERCCIGRGVSAFRFKEDNSFYTYTYYKMKSLMNEIKQFNETGTVFGSISRTDFESIDVALPDTETINKFQVEAKPIDDKVIKNTTQIRTLTALRDTLLPKLMSGELKVEINQR